MKLKKNGTIYKTLHYMYNVSICPVFKKYIYNNSKTGQIVALYI